LEKFICKKLVERKLFHPSNNGLVDSVFKTCS